MMMMYMPGIFGENLMDDFLNDAFSYAPAYSKSTANLMKTDIKEQENGYEMKIDLPGFKKEDLKLQLKDGYLNIGVSSSKSNDEKDGKGNYIRRERYTGSYSRSFYVGDGVTQDEVKAKFDNGVLKLTVPKKEAVPEVETNHYIAIEG